MWINSSGRLGEEVGRHTREGRGGRLKRRLSGGCPKSLGGCPKSLGGCSRGQVKSPWCERDPSYSLRTELGRDGERRSPEISVQESGRDLVCTAHEGTQRTF